MKTAVSVLSFFFIGLNTFTQNVDWVKSIATTETISTSAIFEDDLGNIYQFGVFRGKVDFDPGSDTSFLTSSHRYFSYALKLNSDGEFQWVRQIAGQLIGATIDDQNNLIIGGTFIAKADFDPGTDTSYLTPLSSGASYVLKLNSSGDFIWAKKFEEYNSLNHLGHGIEISTNNTILLSGWFEGSIEIPFDTGIHVLRGAGREAFCVKLNSNGSPIWAYSTKGDMHSGDSKALGSVSDDDGNVYLFGEFSGSVNFNPFNQNDKLDAGISGQGFLTKLDYQGTYLWTKTLESNESNLFLAAQIVEKSLYLIGMYSGRTDFDLGSDSSFMTGPGSFILSLDSSGAFKWVKDPGLWAIQDVALGTHEKIVLCGELRDSLLFNPIDSLSFKKSNGSSDIVLLSYDSVGNFLWVETFGGAQLDKALRAFVNSSDEVVCSGIFSDVIDFTVDTISGSNDLFILKIIPSSGIPSTAMDKHKVILTTYPNPSPGKVVLEFTETNQNISLRLKNTIGQVLKTENFVNTNRIEFDLEQPTGVYFIEVSVDNSIMKIVRIVKNL